MIKLKLFFKFALLVKLQWPYFLCFQMEMVWHHSANISGLSNVKKDSVDSIKWPQWK